MKPTEDNILVKLDSRAKRREGVDMRVPDHALPKRGKIVAVGPGKTNEHGAVMPLELKVGQRVLAHSYCGTELDVDGKPHVMLRASDVLATLDEEDEEEKE